MSKKSFIFFFNILFLVVVLASLTEIAGKSFALPEKIG